MKESLLTNALAKYNSSKPFNLVKFCNEIELNEIVGFKIRIMFLMEFMI